MIAVRIQVFYDVIDSSEANSMVERGGRMVSMIAEKSSADSDSCVPHHNRVMIGGNR